MIRVLAICHEDPAWILGGMGTHVRELYRTMAARGDVHVDLLTSGPGEGSTEYLGFTKHQSDKYTCWKPPNEDMSALLCSDIQLMKTLTRLIAEGHRWDVIHVHEWNTIQVGRMAKQALQVPMVGTMHLCLTYLAEYDMKMSGDTSVPKWADHDIYMRQQEGHLIVTDTDELILCSEAYVRIIRETFMTERPINMIYNGINREEWNPENGDGERAKQKHELNGRPVALYVGRVADMKGIRDLLKAIEDIDSGYQVVISGEVNASTEEQRESWDVTKRIRRLEGSHPERLRWVGFNHGQNLRDLYASADVVLMPSNHEPFGIVALEAMAMGVPLIATERDGLGEIVTDGSEEYALIIPPHSSGAILEALAMTKRPEVRSELRDLGFRRTLDFTWESAVEQTVQVYRNLLGLSQREGVSKCQAI